MSIQKDVEQMYRDDMEKSKKNKRKKKRKRIAVFIAVLILIAAVLLLLNYLGLGLGMGKGSGKNESNDSNSSVSQAIEDSSSQAVEEYIDIKVSGSTYIYQGQEISLDKFAETVRLMADNVVVKIVDDNGTKNAVSDLEDALKKDGRKYLKEHVSEDGSSQNDSSSESSGQE